MHLQENTLYDLFAPAPATSYDRLNLLRPTVKEDTHLQENTLFDLDPTLHIIWPMHLQSLKLLRPAVWEDVNLQENT